MVLFFLTTSCKKDKQSEGKYTVTHYADITLNGDEVLYLNLGDDYDELGAIATEGDEEIDVSVSGNVDTDTPGLYKVGYTAVNSDGFANTSYRTVFVLIGTPSEDFDFVGSFQVTDRGPYTATITEVVPGLYRTSDIFGWSPTYKCPSYIMTDGESILVPLTDSPYGSLEAVGSYDELTGGFDVTITLWDQGPAVIDRTWEKN